MTKNHQNHEISKFLNVIGKTCCHFCKFNSFNGNGQIDKKPLKIIKNDQNPKISNFQNVIGKTCCRFCQFNYFN